MRGLRFVSAVWLLCAACGGAEGDVLIPRGARTQTAKLIASGHDKPQGAADLSDLRAHLAEAEATPFDGLVVDLGVETAIVAGKPLDFAPAEAALAELLRIPFRKFTDNFQALRLSPLDTPTPFSWDDDAFFSVAERNLEAAAALINRGHLRGFFVDNQVYGQKMFSHPAHAQSGTFEEVERKVAARAEALMAAVLRGHPDVTLMFAWTYSELARQVCIEGQDLKTHLYGLYPAFLDGLLRAQGAQKGATVIDAYLPAYPTKQASDFAAYYHLIHFDWQRLQAAWRPGITTHWDAAPEGQRLSTWTSSPRLVCTPETLARLGRDRPAGFGVMIDYGGRPLATDPAQFTQNYFTPEDLTATVRAALRKTDRYVWIWNESLNLWGLSRLTAPAAPRAYLDALARAR